MWIKNISLAFRQMKKNVTFTSITIVSLSASMIVCLFIFQYAGFELSFDRGIPNASHTYRLNLRTFEDGQLRNESALLPIDAMPQIREKLTGIETSTQFYSTAHWFDCAFTYRSNGTSRTFNENKTAYAEPSALKIFNYKIKAGDKTTALHKPYTMVISESTALKYFGDEEAVGKVLLLRGSGETHEYTVTAVMENPPINLHIWYDILLSFSSTDYNPERGFMGTFVYVVLNEDTQPEFVQERLTFLSAALPADDNQRLDLVMEPVTNIHLNSEVEDQPSMKADAMVIYFMLTIALVILILAWINYANLAMARSFARFKEVAIRKTSGATQRQIIEQFLVETFLYNLISFVIAAAVVYLASPMFYEFVGISFPWDKMFWTHLGIMPWIAIAIFSIGMLLSGGLPAYIMASTSAVTALKRTLINIGGGFKFRQASVMFQFVCAIGLMMGVITISRQFDLMSSESPGVDFSRTLVVKSPSHVDSTYRNRLAQLRTALQSHSIVERTFTGTNIFVLDEGWTGEVRTENSKTLETFLVNIIDPDFIDGFGLKLLAGRNFEVADYPGSQFGEKEEPLILNLTGIRRLGFDDPADAIGAKIFWETNRCRIVGVIEDIRQRSAKVAVGPAFYTANNGSSLSLQLARSATGENFRSSVQTIQQEWDKLFPENGFDFFMLSDLYQSLYQGERQVKNFFQFFCLVAIVISCLGLFALSLFSTSRRAREMSIRKVLGAPKVHVVALLTKEYAVMICVAALVSLPFTWWGIEKWLSDFALRVDVGTLDFLLPLVIVFVFAAFAIGIQTVRVANRNPVESLKAE